MKSLAPEAKAFGLYRLPLQFTITEWVLLLSRVHQ